MTGSPRQALDFVRSLDLAPGDYAIFGSGPLMIRGIIAESDDLDVLCRGAAWKRVRAEGRLRHLAEYDVTIAEFLDGRVTFGTRWAIGDFSVDELIDTAEVLDGLPFVKLCFVIDYKRIANRAKDRAHLRAWREYCGLA